MGKGKFPLVRVEFFKGTVYLPNSTKPKRMSSYRVHTAGSRASGRAVSPWFESKAAAIRQAKSMSQRTGKRYVILKPVAVVSKLGRKA